MKNLNVVKRDEFEDEMRSLNDDLSVLRKEQQAFEATVAEHVADIRESCRTIAAEIFKSTHKLIART